MTQQRVSHRPIKCQFCSWSQKGTKVNRLHHGDNPLHKPRRIQIAKKNLPGASDREYRKFTKYSFYCPECCQYFRVIKSNSKRFLALGGLNDDKLSNIYKQWHRSIPKRFIKPLYSISRATSIDSDCCRLPSASVLSNKEDESHSNQFRSTNSRFSRPRVMQK